MSPGVDSAIEALIEWAVAPEPPLPAVAETGAVAAFRTSLQAGPRSQRLAIDVLLLGLWAHGGLLRRWPAGRLAPLGEALAALAQLAYYGEPTVLELLGCPP